MKGIAVKIVVTIILAVVVIAALVTIFTVGMNTSPIEARRTFSEGCVRYCREISDMASTGEPLGVAAVEKGNELAGSSFIRACNMLYPETTGYPYLCWLQNCCGFEFPMP